MDAVLDTWCTRFAAGAGSQYVWYLSRTGTIRANCGRVGIMCPLTAESNIETGKFYGAWRALWAGYRQGLVQSASEVIMDAADNYKGADQALRARLLRICGLMEGA